MHCCRQLFSKVIWISRYCRLGYINPFTPASATYSFYSVWRQMILLVNGDPTGVKGLIKIYFLPTCYVLRFFYHIQRLSWNINKHFPRPKHEMNKTWLYFHAVYLHCLTDISILFCCVSKETFGLHYHSLQIFFLINPFCSKPTSVFKQIIDQRCIQVFKFGGPLDPLLKNLGVHFQVLGVQLIYSTRLIINIPWRPDPCTGWETSKFPRVCNLHKHLIFFLHSNGTFVQYSLRSTEEQVYPRTQWGTLDRSLIDCK